MFVDYQAPKLVKNYLYMVRLKSKTVKLRYNAKEPGSSGGDYTENELPSNPIEEGEYSDNVEGVIRVSNNLSIELLSNSKCKVVDKAGDQGGILLVHPLLVTTPRLVEPFVCWNETARWQEEEAQSQACPEDKSATHTKLRDVFIRV